MTHTIKPHPLLPSKLVTTSRVESINAIVGLHCSNTRPDRHNNIDIVILWHLLTLCSVYWQTKNTSIWQQTAPTSLRKKLTRYLTTTRCTRRVEPLSSSSLCIQYNFKKVGDLQYLFKGLLLFCMNMWLLFSSLLSYCWSLSLLYIIWLSQRV